jgi:hypothetical protein
MKAFNQFLVDINDGSTHSGLTSDLTELLQTVQSTGRSGSLTLKLKVASASKGGSSVDKITITAERKLELPKPEQPQDFFWLTDDAEPTRQHPRQHALDLRNATDERGGLREPVATAFAATFTTPDADGVITNLKAI